MIVDIWECPTPRCGNYYASSAMAGVDLTKKMNMDLKQKPTHSRARCPDCKARGIEVDRILKHVDTSVFQ